ncbi:MAG: N-acetylmuramoyl-L-alanine amidase [Acidobacteriota bacterium]
MRDQIRSTGGNRGERGGRPDPSLLRARAIEPYISVVQKSSRPDISLRFIQDMTALLDSRRSRFDQTFRFIPRPFRGWFDEIILTGEYHRSIQQNIAPYQVTPVLRKALNDVSIPFWASLYCQLYRSRHAIYALGVVLAGLLIFATYSLASWSARRVNSYLTQKYQRYRAPIIVTTAGQASAGTPPSGFAVSGAKYLPGYKPEQVWQVEQTAEFERFSNGARILKRYETDNRPRGYYLIPRGGETLSGPLRREAVGIVYHTSESDIVPFVSANNQSIQYRSKGLLEYVRRNKSYNYIIDRFGEIYRIVRDDHTAFHAGNSIWGDDRYSYVGLNESFIGICFESTSTAGTLEETLTEAQIVSGRALTNVLRSRYSIEDANCTTHGLVSINPERMVVAYHYDWVRNFPFEAMGLSDKYKVPPPNILDYGCVYDEETLEKLKNVLWPGAVAAEQEFRRRVERSRIGADALRSKLRDRYYAQLNRTRQQNTPGGASEVDQSASSQRC